MISKLIAALQNLNFEPTDEDIADMLWLALHTGPLGPEEPISHSEKERERLDQPEKPSPSDDTHLESQAPPQTDPIPKSTTDELYLVTQGEEIKASGLGAVSFKTPKVSALPGTLGLARALRPLMRRVPSRIQTIVDEKITAQQVAEQGIWLPVLKPAPERWLELALVIDESMSQNIWWQTIAELQLLLEHQGAFRDVRTWGLVVSTDGNNLQLRAGLGVTTGKQQLRNPSELIEPSGRRLILVVSDCVSSSWYTSAILEILAKWGQSCPIAIIQVLPRWLWTKSVLRNSVTADLYTRTPGLPNMQLDYNSSSYWIDNEQLKGWLPMPVVTLEQQSLSIWAKAIMSAGNAWMPGYMFDVQKKERVSELETKIDQKVSTSLTAEQRLKRFRTTASPTARVLTELLAATPITLPIVRFIQQSMLSEPQKGQFIDQQGHIAEIFLSGLLKQLPMNEDVVDPDQVQYDFVDGVRELLLSSLPRSQSVQVLMKFTDFVESHADQFPDLAALLTDPMSARGDSLTEKSRPFAVVTAQVLRRLGGGYIPLAEQIESVSTDLSPKVEFPEIPIEAPPSSVDLRPNGLPVYYVNQLSGVVAEPEHLDVYDVRNTSYDVILSVTTLTGLINRQQPKVYLLSGSNDTFWLNQVFAHIPHDISPARGEAALEALLTSYRNLVAGLVIYDPDFIDSVNVATTLAGQKDCMVVSPALAQTLQGTPHQLPVVADLRTYHWQSRVQAYLWAESNLLKNATPALVAGLDPEISGALRSFLVATRTFVYWLDARDVLPNIRNGWTSERSLMRRILKAFAPGTVHLGWYVNESLGVIVTSEAALPMLASDFFHNLEIWTSIQNVGAGLAPARPDTAIIPTLPSKIYLSFTLSVGDNLQYIQNRMAQLWHDPVRGTIPIGWTISPTLVQAAPALAAYYTRTAAPNDELVAGPSGAGYMMPSNWPAQYLPAFLQRTGELMQAMNLHVIEVLDTVLFSQAFINQGLQQEFVNALAPFGIRGILSGSGQTQSSWKNIAGIPILQNLGPADSVDKAVNLVRNATSKSGNAQFLNVYVTPWSVTPSNLKQVIQQLGNEYEVVTPGKLLAMIASGFSSAGK